MTDWFTTSPESLLAVALSAVGVYAAVILLTQVAGLRSFAKMSGFDFAMTVAVGSTVASAMLTKSPSLPEAVVGLAVLYAFQALIAVGRRRSDAVRSVVDNEPVLVMTRYGFLHENLRAARLSEDDVWAKLRAANVLDLSTVRAVVLETTGDVSVLAGEGELDARVLSGVRDAERAPDVRSAPDPAGDPFV